jgi:predicted ATPase/class 3 adenylate cyclase
LKCANCGAENRADAKFCNECGAKLSLVCPNGHPVSAGAKFCDECGAPLRAQPAPADTRPVAPAAPASERRLVSVLFADLVGFTTLSESRDAEEVRELLSRYFDSCRRLITRYGGTVEKFIGDAVMAVWGTPIAREDDAERAVRAALELVDAVTALGAEVGAPDLRARAGVLTGEAAVSIGATSEGMVAGDLVNTASRIQSAAQPGTVYVGEGTRRSTDAGILFEPAGTHELKGKAEPMTLWRAVRVIAGLGGAFKQTGLEPPFVGRDREIRQMKELFHSSIEDKKAHLVSVVGIGGIGKSRLAWEFFKYIEGLLDLIRWHRGRCLSYGEGVTYWALAEMVRMRARIVEGEETSEALAKLHASVEEHLSDPEERKWVEPRLAHLLGLEERVARDSEDLFAAWRVFFERIAEKHPVVMVFEDMQWADESLVDFIEYLTNWSRNHPIFVVTLGRPEFLERHPDWGAGKRAFTSMYLEPLSAEAMEQLLDGVVPGLPSEVREKILDRAEGVPLYAVETVRMLMDRGLLEAEDNAYRVTGSIDTLEVPETLHALIAARLDGLTEWERRAIQDASVLGKTFSKDALAALTGLAIAEAEGLLESLVRKEVLAVQVDFRSPEQGQYGFLQDLVRRVAYETMSRKERKARHLAAAELLEQGWGKEEEEIVEVLASHYLEAYRAVPDASDAAQIKTKAREALVQAGKRAASLAAAAEGLRYYQQAIELADDDVELAPLREQAGNMALLDGRLELAREHLQMARQMFERLKDLRSAARVSAVYGGVLLREGHLEEALDMMEHSLAVLSDEEPDHATAMLAAQLGRTLYFNGRAEDAAKRIEQALTIGETLRLPEVISQAMNTKSLILQSSARDEEAILLLKRALEIALENNLGEAALRAYNNLAAFLEIKDKYQDVLDICEEGLEFARKQGNRPWEQSLFWGQVGPLVLLGRWDDVLAAHDEEGTSDYLGAEPVFSSFVLTERGELDAARAVLTKRDMSQSEDVQLRAAWHARNACVARAEGDLVSAWESALLAFESRVDLGTTSPMTKDGFVEGCETALVMRDMGKVDALLSIVRAWRPGEVAPYMRAQFERFTGRLAIANGEDPTAPMREGLRAFEEMSMPFWAAVASLELAEWLVGERRGGEAAPLIEQARATFEQLRATPWLERLEASGALETIAQAT